MSEPFLHLSRAAFTIVRKGWPGWTRGCMHPVLQLWGLPENAQHDPGQPAGRCTLRARRIPCGRALWSAKWASRRHQSRCNATQSPLDRDLLHSACMQGIQTPPEQVQCNTESSRQRSIALCMHAGHPDATRAGAVQHRVPQLNGEHRLGTILEGRPMLSCSFQNPQTLFPSPVHA
eukprot:1137554-Pelagomonas_calceolata.AAC.11